MGIHVPVFMVREHCRGGEGFLAVVYNGAESLPVRATHRERADKEAPCCDAIDLPVPGTGGIEVRRTLLSTRSIVRLGAALCVVLALAVAAFAVSAAQTTVDVDGGFFTAQVPSDGWKVERLSGSAAVILSADRSIAISVCLMEDTSLPLAEAAERLAALHGSADLVRMEGKNEAWEYTGREAGQPLYAQLFALAGRYGCIAVAGDYESPVAVEVFNSIQIH